MANRSIQQWLEEILKLASNGVLSDPLIALAKVTGKSTPGVRQALKRLESLDMIQITLGERRGRGQVIRSIRVSDSRINPPPPLAKSAEPTSFSLNKVANEVANDVANDVAIAVMIDFDNLTSPSTTKGAHVSFAKLRELIRSYGRAVYSAAFLSPSATRLETISILWSNGFTAIACPFERKEKDSVDAQIKNVARFLAEFSRVCRIVIISGDTDFSDDPALVNFIRDFGKEPLFINPSDIIGDVRGDDIVQELKPIIAVSGWYDILTMAQDEGAVRDEKTQNRIDFMKKIAAAAAAHADPNMQRGFKHLADEVTRSLRRTMDRAFTDLEVRNVLSAFVDKNVLIKHVTHSTNYSDGITYYVFDRSSKLLPRATLAVVPNTNGSYQQQQQLLRPKGAL